MNTEFIDLVSERQYLIVLIDYLTKKIDLLDDSAVKQLLIKDKKKSEEKLKVIEDEFIEFGLILFLEDTSLIFNNVNQEIDELKNSNELLEWIKKNCNKTQLKYIQNIETSSQEFNTTMTGKWFGKFISKKGFAPGEFSIGICQLGSKIFGFGALIGSIYSKIFIKGLIDEDEVKIELQSVNEEVSTFFEGVYKSENDFPTINGNYYVVDGFDEGRIESMIAKGIAVPMSQKTNQLILISNLKKQIATGDQNKLIEVLDKINETFEDHQLESIVHKRRLNLLLKNKRMGGISFGDYQLEESQIAINVLSLISEIEKEVKRN